MDRGDWELAFEPLEGHAYAAIRMGFNIRMLRKYLDAQIIKPRPVVEALDLAKKPDCQTKRSWPKWPRLASDDEDV